MRMKDIIFYEEEQSDAASTGTYIKFVPDDDSKNRIYEIAKDLVENPLDPKEYHMTIVYSRKEFNPGHSERPIMASADITTLEPLGDGGSHVLHVDCDFAHKKHEYYRDVYGATHDYESFTPHVTITYDGTIIDKNFKEKLDRIGPINFVKEVVEDLDLDWKDKL